MPAANTTANSRHAPSGNLERDSYIGLGLHRESAHQTATNWDMCLIIALHQSIRAKEIAFCATVVGGGEGGCLVDSSQRQNPLLAQALASKYHVLLSTYLV